VKKNIKKNGILLMLVMLFVFFTPQKMDADTISMGETYENNVTVRFIPSKTDVLPKTGELRMDHLKKAGFVLLLLVFIGIKDKHTKKSE
jgi:hypothetical protein